MSSDGSDTSDWASPSQPAPPPAYPTPAATGGWGADPPPSPYGWAGPPPGWPPQAPKPGVIPLRPLGVGELLDGAFSTIRRYPAATLGLAAAVMVVLELIQVPLSYYLLHGATTDINGRTDTVDAITQVATLLATVVLSGMLTTVVGQAVLGRPMSIGDAWRATKPLLLRLLGMTLLIVLITVGILLVGALPGILIAVAGAHVAGVLIAVFGGLGAGVFDIYVVICLIFSSPALVLEKQGIRASMRRSRVLIKGSWWRVFGIFLLATLVAGSISAIILIPFSADSFLSILNGNRTDQYRFTPLLLSGIGTLIAGTLVRPFSASVIALLYLDRRMRAEALDLTLAQAAAKTAS